MTKLDVMDELAEINICTAYELDGQRLDVPPIDSDAFEACKPIYETVAGWQSSTQGIKQYDDLPEAAKAYLNRLSSLLDVPIALISTGPDREETIEVRPLFEKEALDKIA